MSPKVNVSALLSDLLHNIRSDTQSITKRVNGISSPPELVKNWLPSLAIVGAILSVIQFWSANIYEPATRPPFLIATAVLEQSAENESFIAVKGTLKLQNKSKIKITMLYTTYHVIGNIIDFNKTDAYDVSSAVTYLNSRETKDYDAVSFDISSIAKSNEIQSFGKMFDGVVLYPDEEVSSEFISYIPKGVYDHLELVSLGDVYKDEFLSGIVRTCWRVGREDMTGKYDCNSKKDDYKGGAGDILSAYVETNEMVYPFTTIFPRWVEFTEANPRHRKIRERYGLAGFRVHSMMSLWKKPN